MAQKYELSWRQEKILQEFQRHAQTHDRPPTLRELAGAVGLKSIGALSYQIKQLEEKALLARERHVARGLQLTDEARTLLGRASGSMARVAEAFSMPIVGDIGASRPLDTGNDTFATYDDEERVTVDAGMLPRRQEGLYAVRVRGDSMIDALVCDSDVVIMQPAYDVRDGDMVAAWLKLEQELTLKKLFREGDTIRLQPANHTMDPIYTPAANVTVQARVVSILRRNSGRARA